MQTSNFWHKYHIHRHKIIVFAAFLTVWGLICFNTNTYAQKAESFDQNLPFYDQKWLHYGFAIGVHSSQFRLQYADRFATEEMDSVHSIDPSSTAGFSLGFVINFRLHDQFDFRLHPKVGFYQYRVQYNFTTGAESDLQVSEPTTVGLPILLKYKSMRRKNTRMYLIGGLTPSIEATNRRKEDNIEDRLVVTGNDLSLEFGFGLDLYFQYFKFSPELRFTHGLVNVLNDKENFYGKGIKRLSTNTITLYLLFE